MLDELAINPITRQLIDKTLRALPHALILHGQNGVGLGQIASAMAAQSGTHLETIVPKKRQANGSYDADPTNGTIIIDDIRQLYTRTRSKFSSSQIVIIDFGSRSMSTGAQNAFLKLLEEPQEAVHFILAVQDLGGVLPTILSRCQRIDVMLISNAQSQKLLDSLQVTDATKRARIQFIAEGLPEEMTRLATDETYYETRIQTVQDARKLLEGDAYTRLVTIQGYKDKRPLTLQLLDDTMRQLKLSLQKSPSSATIQRLDAMIDARQRIQANGNISLTLANVLL